MTWNLGGLIKQICFWGAIGSIVWVFSPIVTMAQITPDATLSTSVNGSTTQPCIGICLITDGTRRGGNLFHSLQQFSLPNNTDQARFVTSPAVQNVIVRVTGVGQPFISTINGTIFTVNEALTAISPANLFLINPNGIIFGPNARLNIGGSFTATTATAVEFGNQGQFSATNPNNSVPLLTVNPSAYWYNQLPTGSIVNRSGDIGLQVADGQRLTLLGGAVEMDGGRLNAWGGRVELGAVAGSGQVEILPNGSLNIDPGVARGNVTLTDGARVEVRLNGGGAIGITAADIRLAGGSLLFAGISTTGGTAASRAGDVRLNATGSVSLEESSQIRNTVAVGVTGNAGNLVIDANRLQVTGGARLSASTFGRGNGGNVVIDVRDRVLFQGSTGQVVSAAFSRVAQTGVGRGGDVQIEAGSLEVRDGAQLLTATEGQGDAGNVRIQVRDRVLFQNGAAFSNVTQTGIGQGGNVVIVTGNLEVRDGAQLNASTSGTGDAGNVLITARDRVLFPNLSGAFSSVDVGKTGNGGNVVIVTGTLEVRNGAQLGASTFGTGDAGNVLITARDRVLFQGTNADGRFGSAALSNVAVGATGKGGNVVITTSGLAVRDGAQLLASTEGIGDAGNVQITARDRVLFQGNQTTVFSSVEGGATGQGGNVVLDTDTLEVRDGAQLGASTFGTGDAGNVLITARDRVLLDGINSSDGRSSGILNSNGTINSDIGSGRGGNIQINTPQLQVSNSAVMDARTVNDQRGGNITLNLDNLSLLSGGQIFTTSEGSGPAGTISITVTGRVNISGTDPTYGDRLAQFTTAVAPLSANSGLYVRSTGTGPAGEIRLTTPQLVLDQQGRIDAQSATVSGGNLFLTVPQVLLLRNGGQISATAGTANPQAPGNGGNININAPFIVAVPKENSDITANATQGRGGTIQIENSQGIFGLKVRPKVSEFSDITASSEGGPTGTINIAPPNVDPNSGLISLPQVLSDPSSKIVRGCTPDSAPGASRFVTIGRGGLPPNPNESLSNSGLWQDARTATQSVEKDAAKELAIAAPTQIIEATHWLRKPDGSIKFAVQPSGDAPTNTPPVLAQAKGCYGQ
jgi:filamentous hemagglutinin family protein